MMLRAYIDESEQARMELFAIGGYLFDRPGERRFEVKWKRALKQKALTRFHLTDFENRQGQFKGWNEKDRVAFLRQLHKIILDTSLMEISVVLDVRVYEQLVREEPDLIGVLTPYEFCFTTCIGNVARKLTRMGREERISYVADQVGPKAGKGYLMAAYNRLARYPEALDFSRIESMEWADTRKRVHLQAADIWAYEATKAMAVVEQRTDRPLRQSIVNLVHTDPAKRADVYVNEPLLRTYVEGNRVLLAQQPPGPLDVHKTLNYIRQLLEGVAED